MFVNTDKKGIIIGKGGQTIKNIRNVCGGGNLRIQFKDLNDSKTEVIFIGESWQVSKAKTMVQNIIYKSNPITRNMREPNNLDVKFNEYISIAKKNRVRVQKNGKIISIQGIDQNCRLCECDINKYYRQFQKKKIMSIKTVERKLTFNCLLELDNEESQSYDESKTNVQEKQIKELEDFPCLTQNVNIINSNNNAWFKSDRKSDTIHIANNIKPITNKPNKCQIEKNDMDWKEKVNDWKVFNKEEVKEVVKVVKEVVKEVKEVVKEVKKEVKKEVIDIWGSDDNEVVEVKKEAIDIWGSDDNEVVNFENDIFEDEELYNNQTGDWADAES